MDTNDMKNFVLGALFGAVISGAIASGLMYIAVNDKLKRCNKPAGINRHLEDAQRALSSNRSASPDIIQRPMSPVLVEQE